MALPFLATSDLQHLIFPSDELSHWEWSRSSITYTVHDSPSSIMKHEGEDPSSEVCDSGGHSYRGQPLHDDDDEGEKIPNDCGYSLMYGPFRMSDPWHTYLMGNAILVLGLLCGGLMDRMCGRKT